MDLDFDFEMLKTLVGGSSVISLPRLRLRTRDEVRDFLLAYGYDLNEDSDTARLWSFHRRAVTYIETQLLNSGERVPPEYGEAILVKDIANLFLWASMDEASGGARQRWCCAILRVMHVINHLTNDLFTVFSDDIQEQILRPYQDVITTDENGAIFLGKEGSSERIELAKFDIKPFKTSNSSITKLLAKPEEVAFSLLDKMGVRFVTHSVLDCFRVLRWLVRHHVISTPHLIPDQSNNTLYPLNLFEEVVAELKARPDMGPKEIDRLMQTKVKSDKDRASYREKINVFTSRDYRFMKFIVRRLIRARAHALDRPLMFFYPYEVQVMDELTFNRNSIGPSSHTEYKSRQKRTARERVFGAESGIPE